MQTASEIISNYREVKSRLWGAPAKPVVTYKPPAPAVLKTGKPRRVSFKIIHVKGRKRPRRQSLPQGALDRSLKAACKRWGEAASEVLGKRRYRRCVLVRIDVINDLHNVGWSYAGIGRALNMDHSSVLHLHKKYTPDSDAYRRLVAAEERNPT